MAHELFADWYGIVNAAVDSETFAFRKEGVEALEAQADLPKAMTLVRLYLGLSVPPSDQQEIRQVFSSIDQRFKQRDNDHELRILAASALAGMICDDESLIGGLAAMAIRLNAPFFEDLPIQELVGLSTAHEAIRANSGRKVADVSLPARTIRPTKALASMKAASAAEAPQDMAKAVSEGTKVIESLVAQHDEYVEALARISRNQRVVDEESNVLWWLLSRELPEEVDDAAARPLEAAAMSALDFAMTLRIAPPPTNRKALMARFLKVMGIDSGARGDVASVCRAMPDSWKERALAYADVREVGSLCPTYTLAVAGGGSDADGVAGILPPSLEMSAVDLMQQMADEIAFCKACSNVR